MEALPCKWTWSPSIEKTRFHLQRARRSGIFTHFSSPQHEGGKLGFLFTLTRWKSKRNWRTQPQLARRDFTLTSSRAGVTIQLHIASLVTTADALRETWILWRGSDEEQRQKKKKKKKQEQRKPSASWQKKGMHPTECGRTRTRHQCWENTKRQQHHVTISSDDKRNCEINSQIFHAPAHTPKKNVQEKRKSLHKLPHSTRHPGQRGRDRRLTGTLCWSPDWRRGIGGPPEIGGGASFRLRDPCWPPVYHSR